MKLVLNNITDRPSSYNRLKDVQSSNIVRLIEDPEIKKTIRFDEMSIENIPDPTTEQGGDKKIYPAELRYFVRWIPVPAVLYRRRVKKEQSGQTNWLS